MSNSFALLCIAFDFALLSTVKEAMHGGLCTNILVPWYVAPSELLPELVFAVICGATVEYWPSGGYPV